MTALWLNSRKPTGKAAATENLTIHLILTENRTLKAKTTQMTGQMMSPSQKIRDSESEACCFPEPCRKRDTQSGHLKTLRHVYQKHHKEVDVVNKPSWTQTPSGSVRHRPPGSTSADPPLASPWCSGNSLIRKHESNTLKTLLYKKNKIK